MTEPTNTCGFHIERYSHELGWKPCTAPVATYAEAAVQFQACNPATHRIYDAINGYTLADQLAQAAH